MRKRRKRKKYDRQRKILYTVRGEKRERRTKRRKIREF